MIIVDPKTFKILEDYDENKGYITVETFTTYTMPVIDVPAVIRKNKDGEDVVEQEAVVHYDELNIKNGYFIKDVDLESMGLVVGETVLPGFTDVGLYTPYTPEQLAEREEAKREEEKRQELYEAIPGRLETVESTQDDIVLLLADIVGGAI